MAMGIVFECTACSHRVEAWDEGNPYYVDESGRKRHAHHPSPDHDRCTGDDASVMCLACGERSMSDSAAPIAACPRCASSEPVDLWEEDGRVPHRSARVHDLLSGAPARSGDAAEW